MEELKPSLASSSPLTPLDFLERAATVYGDCPSLIYNSTTYTWSQTHRRCLQLASTLSSIGLHHPHVVSALAPNLPAMYELHFAVPMTGAILNNLNTRLDARTLCVLLRHSQSKLLFVDVLLQPLVAKALSMFPPGITPPDLVLITDDYIVAPPRSHDDYIIETYEGMVSKGDAGFRWVRPPSDWDPMVLNYTSGTTSSPKGVVHCHRGIFIMAVSSLIDWSVPRQPVYLWTLAMFHSNGWGFPYGIAAVGGTNVCIRRIEALLVYDLIRRHRVTHMCAAPTVLNMLANSRLQPVGHPVNVLTGGSTPPLPVILRAEATGFVLTHGYGMTETVGCVVTCAWKPQWNRLPTTERSRLKARQGMKTICLTQLDVVDPGSGRSIKWDGLELGEVVLRGGPVMLGYYKDPEATRRCLRDGWLYTGDVAVVHPDGYIEIKDRSKDVIISGGENISSVEVETVMYAHPAVNEVAVVARPDKFWGETPCAFVSLRKGECDESNRKLPGEKDLVEYCRERLPHYMVPKTVVIKDQLPKTSTGKIQKAALREMAKAMDPPITSAL